MNPEELAMMEEDVPEGAPEEMGMPQDESSLVPDGGMGEEIDPSMMMNDEDMMNWESGGIDPTMVVQDLVVQYVDYVIGIKDDQTLNKDVQANIMNQIAQSITQLMSVVPNQDQKEQDQMKLQMEFQLKQQEFELRAQEMQMQMEMEQQKHQMEMQFKQDELQMKLQEQQIKGQMAIQQHSQKMEMEKEKHIHSTVQSQEAHESSMKQQEQAAKSKQTNKDSK